MMRRSGGRRRRMSKKEKLSMVLDVVKANNVRTVKIPLNWAKDRYWLSATSSGLWRGVTTTEGPGEARWQGQGHGKRASMAWRWRRWEDKQILSGMNRWRVFRLEEIWPPKGAEKKTGDKEEIEGAREWSVWLDLWRPRAWALLLHLIHRSHPCWKHPCP